MAAKPKSQERHAPRAGARASAIQGGRGIAAAPQLDRIVHERLRLGIVSALAVNASLTFGELKEFLETTDGNLSVHARKLEDAGYVESVKSFNGRIPRTDFKLTSSGRRALQKYLGHMESIIAATRK